MSRPLAHLAALGRAEFTLFVRARSHWVHALFVPAVLILGLRATMGMKDLGGMGLRPAVVMLSSSAGVILVFTLYVPLAGAYVVRRDDLFLKRLRTGEAADTTILSGVALPAAAVVLAQFALVTAGPLARTAENVPVAVLPLMALPPSTSGTFFPLEEMPGAFQDVARYLPLTPVVDLVRTGWTGALPPAGAGLRIAVLAGWTALALAAARRWFRWEPRV